MIPNGFSVLLPRDRIHQRIKEIGMQLRQELQGKQATFVGVLDGALFFLTDLIRELAMDVKIDFLRVSSYGSGTTSGDLKLISGLTWNISGSHVVLVDDILDTGKTAAFCREHLLALGAANVRTVFLLTKDRHQEYSVPNPLIGFHIPDRFVIGFGLDYDGRYRHLRDIYIMEETA